MWDRYVNSLNVWRVFLLRFVFVFKGGLLPRSKVDEAEIADEETSEEEWEDVSEGGNGGGSC